MTARSSVRASVTWNLAVGPAVIIGNLVLIAASLRTAGGDYYAPWLLCFTAVSFMVAADFGLGAGLVQQVGLWRDRSGPHLVTVTRLGRRYFFFLAVGAAALTLPLLMIYLLIGNDTLPRKDALLFAALAAVAVFGALMGRYYVALTHGHGQFHYERLLNVVGILVRGASVVLVATIWPHAPYLIPVFDVLAIWIVLFGCAVTVGWKKYAEGEALADPDDVRKLGKDLRRISGHSFLSSVATLGAIVLPMYIVGARLSSEAAAVSAGLTRIYQSGRTVLGWVTAPAMPAIAGSDAAGGGSALYRRMFMMSVGVGALMAAPLIVCSEALATTWLGIKREEYFAAFAVTGLGLYIHSVYAPGVVYATARGRPAVAARTNGLWFGATAIAAWPLVGTYGVVGAAVASVGPAAIFLIVGAARATMGAGLTFRRQLSGWLLAGTVAVGLLYLAVLVIDDAERSIAPAVVAGAIWAPLCACALWLIAKAVVLEPKESAV